MPKILNYRIILHVLLSPEIIRKCTKLEAKDREFKKWNRPAVLLVLPVIIIFLAFIIWFPEDADFSDYPWQSYGVGIFSVVSIIVIWFLLQKAKPYNITGYAINTVMTFRAYSLLEKYLEDGIISHLEKAEDQMNSLLSALQTGWGDFSKENPSFKSLVRPVEKFIENLNNRIIPMIVVENEDEVRKMQNTFGSLIMFFMSDNFSQIKKINNELETFPDVSEEEESALEKIKQNRHLVTFFIALLIIGGGWLLSQSTKFIKEDIDVETQLILWAAISVPFSVWMLHARYRK